MARLFRYHTGTACRTAGGSPGLRKTAEGGIGMRRVCALILSAVCLLLPPVAGLSEESVVVETEVVIEGAEPEAAPADPATVFTPSFGSPYDSDLGSAFWTTPMDITDEQAVWDMLMQPITVVDPQKKKYNAKSQVYLYREPDSDSQIIGEVTCMSQGVRVIEHLDNGWSLVECYSSSFHTPATKTGAWNLLVSGYIQTNYLKTVQPSDRFALVVDKLTQRIYVFKDGKLFTTLLCSTGLVQNNGKKDQPYNETRSGEFIFISRVGAFQSDRLTCSYALRFNGGDMIHEVPHVLQADGKTKNYKSTEPFLGQKRSHGCIRVQYRRTPEGVNMKWIYDNAGHENIKIVIWEDWQGRQIPVPSPDTVLYYNPEGGECYHSQAHCYNHKKGLDFTFTPFRYSQLDEGEFANLTPCNYCSPPLRESEIREINAVYAPGGDHEPLLNSLRQAYYDYLREAQ